LDGDVILTNLDSGVMPCDVSVQISLIFCRTSLVLSRYMETHRVQTFDDTPTRLVVGLEGSDSAPNNSKHSLISVCS